jgi:Phage Tail Collar Domain
MSRPVDQHNGVRRVILTTAAQLHPLSNNSTTAAQSYFCYGYDLTGFQYTIDLQARPFGVTIDSIQPNQVWWVEKRTTLYRLYLYAGVYNPATRNIDSTKTIGNVPAGTILSYGGSTAPYGYLVCNGSTYSSVTYPSLFAAIGHNFGGSGTSFKVPNLTPFTNNIISIIRAL